MAMQQLLFSSLLWPASAITEPALLCFAEEEVGTTVKNGTQRTLKPRSGSYRWICFRRFVGPVVPASIHGSSAIQTKGPTPTDRSCLRDKTSTTTKHQWMTFSHQSMILLHQWMIFVGH